MFRPHGCDVFYRNEKVKKAPKHDFWTYWSVLGAFVVKTHIVIRAANLWQLMALLAHVGVMFLTGMIKFKKHQNMIMDILECIGCVRGKNSLRDSRDELLSINANIGICCDPTGAMFLTRFNKFNKHPNMIFGHIGVYWVNSWQKLTSWFARRNFDN